MEQNEHSWFSPSKTEANILCPGRINACKGLDDIQTQDGKLGTECHEHMKSYYSGAATDPDSAFKAGTYQKDAVIEAAKQVDQYIGGLMLMHGQPEMTLEEQVFLPEDPTIFGTRDLSLWFPLTRHLVVLDYKFGMGIVFARENKQGLCYASMDPSIAEAATVDIVIIQPRVKPIDVWTTTGADVLKWKSEVLLPAIEATKNPNAPLIPGDKQCSFCVRGKAGCQAQTNLLLQAFDRIDSIPAPSKKNQPQPDYDGMSAEDLSDALKLIPFMEVAIKNTEYAATARMLKGESIPDFKLVHKETRRKWADEEKADGYLQRKKLKESERYTKKLISPAQAEKLIDVDNLPTVSKNAFRALIEYPIGEPEYAPADDPRSEYTSPVEEPDPSANVMDVSILF